MAKKKFKEIKTMGKAERDKKLKELRMELVKSQANASKGGSAKIRQIRRMIARMTMLNSENGNMS